MKESTREVYDYYIKSTYQKNADFSLLVKGASTSFGALALSKFFNYCLTKREQFNTFDKFCISLAKLIIYTRNIFTWSLINYGVLIILLMEIVLGLFGLYYLRKLVLESVNLISLLQNNDPLNLKLYLSFLEILCYFALSTLLSHSVFKANLYKRNIRIALEIIKNKKVKASITLANKINNNALNPSRRKIGLVKR